MAEETKKELNIKHSRFQDADWYGNMKEIIVGGTGGIGSWTALFLSRIGHTLYLFDDDLIEEHNMAGQLYATKQVGMNKAEATKENIKAFSDSINVEVCGRYTEESPTSPIVISCFDNMAARKLMFSKWKEQEDREIFIDGRMLAEVGMIFCITKGQEAAYEAELFDDAEIQDAPCSFKATSHCGALIGSLMTAGLNNYLANVKLGGEFKSLPFKFEFELPLFNFVEINIPVEEKKVEPVKMLENESTS